MNRKLWAYQTSMKIIMCNEITCYPMRFHEGGYFAYIRLGRHRDERTTLQEDTIVQISTALGQARKSWDRKVDGNTKLLGPFRTIDLLCGLGTKICGQTSLLCRLLQIYWYNCGEVLPPFHVWMRESFHSLLNWLSRCNTRKAAICKSF